MLYAKLVLWNNINNSCDNHNGEGNGHYNDNYNMAWLQLQERTQLQW